MAADDPLLRPDTHQLHVGVSLSRRERVIHRREIRHVDLHRIAVLRASFRFRGADGADRRMGENHRRYQVVIQMPRSLTPEQAIAQAPACGDGHGRQGRPAGHIADRVDTGRTGILKAIRDDETGVIERDAGRFQVEPGDIGVPADRPQYAVKARKLAPILRYQSLLARRLMHRGRYGALLDDHASGANFPHQRLAEHDIEVCQHAVLADELLHVTAEFLKGCRQLAGDIAAADHSDPLRPGFELKKAVRADPQLGAGNLRQHRFAAGRNHHVAGAEALAIDQNGVRIHEPRSPAHVRHPFGRQIAFVDGVQAQHIRIALGFQ